MTVQAFLLALSKEGREWAQLILPVIAAWHLPQPNWYKDKKNA
jgi:hypothetical protein